jgi:hypothetical protein
LYRPALRDFTFFQGKGAKSIAFLTGNYYFSPSNILKIHLMKKRIFQVLNFFAFNLLFFALYLNFIHKDNNSPEPVSRHSTATTSTVLVKNPEQYLQKASQEEVQAKKFN